MSTTKKSSRAHNTPRVAIADHLAELRVRLAWVGLAFVIFSSVAYSFRDILVAVVLAPLGNEKLVYLTPAGGFSFIFQITMYAGALVAAPLAVYHLYKYISPAFSKARQRYGLWIVLASTLLMVMGVSFGYFVAIPAALTFLTHFAGDFVQPNLTADSYLGFVVAYVLGLGILFQLPLLLLLINWVRPFQKGDLLKTQQYVLVGSFIAAAMITPTPDALNQAMVALPIIIIYQAGVIAVAVINRRQRKRATARPWQTQQVVRDIPQQVLFTSALQPRSAASTQVDTPVVTQTVTKPATIQPQIRTRRSLDGVSLAASRSPGVLRQPRPSVVSRPPHQRPGVYHIERPLPSLSLDGIKN